MSYRTAVHYAHQVLALTGKASKYIRDLFEAPDVSERDSETDRQTETYPESLSVGMCRLVCVLIGFIYLYSIF